MVLAMGVFIASDCCMKLALRDLPLFQLMAMRGLASVGLCLLLLLALVGFNLGVEAGQLAIVAAFLPLAYGLRASWFYRRLVFGGGSAVIALVALVWLAERALDVKIWS